MFWPILRLLENDEDGDPFVIGLYVGMPKPTNTDEYLQPLIDDILTIRRDGIIVMVFQGSILSKMSGNPDGLPR